jgi:transposase
VPMALRPGCAAPVQRRRPRGRHSGVLVSWRGIPVRVRAYSMDLRERIVAAVDGGMTQDQAAVTFGVSVNTVGRYLARRRDIGSLAPTVQRHGPRPEKKQRLQTWLPGRLADAADATLMFAESRAQMRTTKMELCRSHL